MRGCCGNSLSQSLRLCQLPLGGSLWRARKLCALAGNFSVLPKAPPQRTTSPGRDRFSPRRGEMSPQVTKRGADVAQRQKGESVERSETGGVCSRRTREQQLFPVWKTACFPAFSTRKNGSGPVLKTCDRFIPDWRKINHRPETVCRMQRKSFDFLFYKRQNARIFAQNLPESCGLNYGAYRVCTV